MQMQISHRLARAAVLPLGLALVLGAGSLSGAQTYCEKWAAQSTKVPAECGSPKLKDTRFYDREGRPLRGKQGEAVCKLEVIQYACRSRGPEISFQIYAEYTPLASEAQPAQKRLSGGVEENVARQDLAKDLAGKGMNWLAGLVNQAVDEDRARRLQEAATFTSIMADLARDNAVKVFDAIAPHGDPLGVLLWATGPYGVVASAEFRAVGTSAAVVRGAGKTALARTVKSFGETRAGKALGKSTPTKAGQGPGTPYEGLPPSQPPIGEPPPQSVKGPPEGTGPSKPPGGEPREARGPPPGSKANPLRGSAVVQEAKNLAGKTIDLGDGTVVTLGEKSAEGGIGTVYKIEGQPDELFKIIHSTGTLGGEGSVLRQARGSSLLKDAEVYNARVLASGREPPYLRVENIKEGKWAAKGARLVGKEPLTRAERRAIKELYDDLGKRGLVWLDGHRGNVFFFQEGGTLKAGILDQDFIYPLEEINSKLAMPGTLFNSKARVQFLEMLAQPDSMPAGSWMTKFYYALYPVGK